jgi:hemerythrin
METIIWDERLLSVGIKKFDEEHKLLISYLNELNQAVKIGSSQNTMEEILIQIIHYTKSHFGSEEKYMKLYQYPDYERHKKEHEMLTHQVNDFYTRLKEGKTSFSLELVRFLFEWLTKHILGTDMRYKKFFSEQGINI